MGESQVILAAGGAVYRQTNENEFEVLLVHRPRYDDWSWPKGKCEDQESLVDCAIREVEEETGIVTEVGPVLCTITYLDQLKRTKAVTYYALEIVKISEHQPDDEIDRLAWVRLEDVNEWLTTASDSEVTSALVAYLRNRA